jgi:small subunit ribosomal protein S1
MTDDKDQGDDTSEDESFADLFEQSLSTAAPLEPGQKIQATILQIGKEWVFLDVGQKGEGVLDVRELQDARGELTAAVGEKVGAYFLSRSGGELRFTTRIGGGATGTEQLEEAWRSAIPVDGRVEKEIKGGYEVRLPGAVRAFCPFSQLGLKRVENPEEVLGQTFPFKITQFSEQGRNVVVSHREILEEERRVRRSELRQTLKEGDVVKGVVTSIRDFGAFVDIGAIEGLLPISEIGYGRVERVDEVLHVGQELELAVKSCDWDKERFSFSLRDTLADPWRKVGSTYREGATLTGTVSRLAPFGAFVTLEEGIDGLVHISRLGEGRHIKHPQEVLKVGQKLTVTIEKLDLQERRISLIPASAGEEGPSSFVEPGGAGMGTLADLLKGGANRKKRR